MKRIQPAGRWAGLIVVALLVAMGAARARSDEGTPAPTKSSPATPEHDHHSMTMPDGRKMAGDPGVFSTIVAEVMDPACFLEAGAKSIGPGHFQCAIDCVRSGQTLALYDRVKDRIYFIAGELPGKNPNQPLLPYIHQKVDVMGRVYHRADAWGIVIIKVTPHQESAAPAAKTGKPASKGSGSGSSDAETTPAPGEAATR
jgi:hypothetical protein